MRFKDIFDVTFSASIKNYQPNKLPDLKYENQKTKDLNQN
jgi:hypothetical protein